MEATCTEFCDGLVMAEVVTVLTAIELKNLLLIHPSLIY
jgi:hypothetical protein